jgi:hypothetical protein
LTYQNPARQTDLLHKAFSFFHLNPLFNQNLLLYHFRADLIINPVNTLIVMPPAIKTIIVLIIKCKNNFSANPAMSSWLVINIIKFCTFKNYFCNLLCADCFFSFKFTSYYIVNKFPFFFSNALIVKHPFKNFFIIHYLSTSVLSQF